MKLLVGSLVLLGVVLVVFFGGMAGSSMALISLSMCGGAIFVWPMVVVAVYRLFAGGAGGRLMWVSESSKTTAPAKPRARSVVDNL